jgi:hypothetical protein
MIAGPGIPLRDVASATVALIEVVEMVFSSW